MNETIRPSAESNVPWPTSDLHVQAPDVATPPDGEKSTAVVGLLNQAVQGAHNTIDRFADSAVPAAQQLGERVSAAADTVHAKTDQLREAGDQWAQSLRTSVRCNPLTALATAFALGAVLVRITR